MQQISLRTTVLRAQDGTVWHVPNGEVMRVGNKSQIYSVAIVDVTVAYSSDIDHVKAVILRSATDMCQSDEWRADVLEPPDLLGVEAFASIGVTVRTLVKTTPGKQWALQRALREGIKSALDEAGIEIPAQRL